MTAPFRTLLGLLAAFSTTVTAQAAQIGDPAAPLEIAEWVKGDAIDLATAKGKKIVVVEFWATWCGPCRASIPHLTELQRKFAERGVVFVGVSDEAASKVKPFVDEMGDKMDYTVAIDRDGKTSEGYMKAYGQNGIPHAFIVDRDGRIAWHGHPMADLEKVLDKMASVPVPENPGDQKRTEAQRLLREFTELAGQGGDEAALARMEQRLLELDRQVGGIVPGQKLDATALRKSARFQTLARQYQIAVAAGKSEAELRALEQQATPFAPAGFKFDSFRGEFSLQRAFQDYYRAVTGKGDSLHLPELTARLEQVKSSDAAALNEMAWTLLTDDKVKPRDVKLALKLAQGAFTASSGKDPSILDTYARALFDNGQPAEAAKQQQRALELTTDDDKRAELEANLKRYQAAPAPK